MIQKEVFVYHMVQKPQINKRGMLAWEYIAIIIIGLVVVFMIVIFSTTIKEKAIEAVTYFSTELLGR